MNHRKLFSMLLSATGMLALILDGRTALQGAAQGLELCIKAIIPSLFPFLFFSALLTTSLWGCSFPFHRHIAAPLGIPKGAEGILISGFLGGYPAGARTIGQAYQQGALDKVTACHLLSFCSNAGPAFLFGITASQFSQIKTVWLLWGIQILSALLTGVLGHRNVTCSIKLPEREMTIAQALNSSVKTMGIICGWVVLFRILLSFLDRWLLWMLPDHLLVLIWGLLELSNGCCALNTLASQELRFIICSVMLAFGGICVTMQTASVIGDLPLWTYLRGKLLQTLLALIFSLCYVLEQSWVILFLSAILLFPGILKKRSSIPGDSRV